MFGADTSVKSHELGNHVPFIPDYLPFLASRGPVAPKCNLPPSPAVQSLFLVTHSPSSTLKSPMVKAPFLFIFNHVWNLLAQVPRESQGGGGGGGVQWAFSRGAGLPPPRILTWDPCQAAFMVTRASLPSDVSGSSSWGLLSSLIAQTNPWSSLQVAS